MYVEPDITQYFRVEMKNSAGISAPSEILKLNPSQLIPGPPKQFEALGKTENETRLQWYKPDINPHAAQKKSHKKQTRHESWETISTTDKLSAVAAGLEPK